MIIPLRRRAFVLLLVGLAAAWGTIVALHYARLGLTLTHYDARGHLIVARRIFDSITPGWQQIGAVWLPLPHLLNAVPIQIDFFYRTGAFAVALSVASFAVSIGAIAWIVETITGSRAAAVAGALVFGLNPSVLYLQSTPMTEPLLVALLLVSIALLIAWTRAAAPALTPQPQRTTATGIAFALACLTRYEAWPVTAAALTCAAWTLWRASHPLPPAIGRVAQLARFPAGAIACFFTFSRVVSGAWFPADFFIPENPAQGRPFEAVSEIVWGLRELSGLWLLVAAAVGAAALLTTGLRRSAEGDRLIAVALAATAAVPFVAFVDGHPYRIRYMVPLVAAQAVFAGVAAGCLPRVRLATAALLAGLVAMELTPLSLAAPMVVEAQWDRPNIAAREPVSRCLASAYRGESVMASMGSLGHYMQDLSRQGFALRDILHEGNGDIWLNALINPRPFVGWILIEEKAEGGDMLAKIARERPAFLKDFTRICEGAGLALYRRNP